MSTKKCPLCESNAELTIPSIKGYKEPDIFQGYYCSNCHTSFAMPRVEANDIYQLIYEKGANVPGYDRYWRYANMVLKQDDPFLFLSQQEPIYWSIRETIKNKLSIPSDAKILEVGSGLGYLTYALQKEGYANTTGLDIAQEAVNKANERYGKYYICADIYEYAPKNENYYDIIILTEVIEHIFSPIPFIKELLRMLKGKGGKLIVTTPNMSFFDFKNRWDSDLPPVHNWWFSEDSFSFITEQLNANVSFLSFNHYYKHHTRDHSTKGKQLYLAQHRFNLLGQINLMIEKQTLRTKIKSTLKRGFLFLLLKKIQKWEFDVYYYIPFICKYYKISGKKTNTICALITKK